MKFSKLFCAAAIHSWEKEPSDQDYLREVDAPILNGSLVAIQTGTQKCTRDDCCAEQLVAREGLSGLNFRLGSWKKISAQEKAAFETLPYIHLC